MQQITDVWTLETSAEECATEDLTHIANVALRGGRKEQSYLRKLWDSESWESIKGKLNTEGSDWYVWFLDGVRQHLANITS